MSNPQHYVIDTNTIIDLQCGNLLLKIFQLPCKFVVTDLLTNELYDPPFHTLSTLGILVESLTSEETAEITVMMGRYEKPSYEDISVLILAKSKTTTLITGDEALRHAAMDNGVNCLGTCWLIDYLADQNLISYTEAIVAYELIKRNRRHPPKDECRSLLTQWRQRQKILD